MSDYVWKDGRTIYWDESTIPAVREMFIRNGFTEKDPSLSEFAFERNVEGTVIGSHARAWWKEIPLSFYGDEENFEIVSTADLALLERCIVATVKFLEFIAQGAPSE